MPPYLPLRIPSIALGLGELGFRGAAGFFSNGTLQSMRSKQAKYTSPAIR